MFNHNQQSNMKNLILTIQAMALLTASEVSAQLLKWSHPHANATVYARAGDGKGGVAFVLRGGSNDAAATVTWIAPTAKVLLNVEIERNHEDAPVNIVRMTGTELAIRFVTTLPGTGTNSNVLRRYVKRGNTVTVTDKILALDEDMPHAPERLTDSFGFFTFAPFQVRRYSN
jgi:hypothetical protein